MYFSNRSGVFVHFHTAWIHRTMHYRSQCSTT